MHQLLGRGRHHCAGDLSSRSGSGSNGTRKTLPCASRISATATPSHVLRLARCVGAQDLWESRSFTHRRFPKDGEFLAQVLWPYTYSLAAKRRGSGRFYHGNSRATSEEGTIRSWIRGGRFCFSANRQ